MYTVQWRRLAYGKREHSEGGLESGLSTESLRKSKRSVWDLGSGISSFRANVLCQIEYGY